MEPITVIVWTYTAVFSMTAFVTIGGLIENFPFIKVKDQYMKGLYMTLILEIVGGAVAIAATTIRTEVTNGQEPKSSEIILQKQELEKSLKTMQEQEKILKSEKEFFKREHAKAQEELQKLQSETKKQSSSLEIADRTTEELLKSYSKTDFSELKELLWQQKWREADIATDALKPIQLECDDLRIVNSLWIGASDGKFGYSKQREIWESGDVNQDYSLFAPEVHWRVDGIWKLNVNQLDISSESPEGQLPFNGWQIRGTRDMAPFMAKLKGCNI